MGTEKFLLPLTEWRGEALGACQEIMETLRAVQGDGGGSVLMGFSEKVRRFLRERVGPHFQGEAKLVEILGRHLKPKEPRLQRLQEDQRRLTGLLRDGSLESMLQFVPLLEDHVRSEEEEFFPLLQEVLTPGEKREAGMELERNFSPPPAEKKEIQGGEGP